MRSQKFLEIIFQTNKFSLNIDDFYYITMALASVTIYLIIKLLDLT